MKNIFMCLAFVVVSAMGETNYQIEMTKIEKNFSQEERFNMLFGKTTLQFKKIRQQRENRQTRSNRKVVSTRLEREDKLINLSTLSQEQRYLLLFGMAIPMQRVARTTRFMFPRQARQNVYISSRGIVW